MKQNKARIKNVEIIVHPNTGYTIKTPTGIFHKLEDVISQYPLIKESKRVKQCQFCNNWFYDYSKFNKRKYCDDECYRKAHIEKVIENRNRKHFVNINPSPVEPKHYTQKIKDYDNHYDKTVDLAFKQDDRYWGLGYGNLTGKPIKDSNYEHKYIKKELKRLGLR